MILRIIFFNFHISPTVIDKKGAHKTTFLENFLKVPISKLCPHEHTWILALSFQQRLWRNKHLLLFDRIGLEIIAFDFKRCKKHDLFVILHII